MGGGKRLDERHSHGSERARCKDGSPTDAYFGPAVVIVHTYSDLSGNTLPLSVFSPSMP